MSINVQIDGLAELEAAASRVGATLEQEVDDGLFESAGYVADRYRSIVPKVSGRMAASAQPIREGRDAAVQVTARRVSRRYPGGFSYPALLERARRYLQRAIQQEITRIEGRMEQVVDDAARQWGGS